MSQADEARKHLSQIMEVKALHSSVPRDVIKVVTIGGSDFVECGSKLYFADRSVLTLEDDGWRTSYMPHTLPTVVKKGKKPWLTVSYWKQRFHRWVRRVAGITDEMRLNAYRRAMRRSVIPHLFRRDAEEAVEARLNKAPVLSPLSSKRDRRVTKTSEPDNAVGAAQSSEHAGGADPTQ